MHFPCVASIRDHRIELPRQAVTPRDLRSLRDFMAEQVCPLGLIINNDERPRLLDEAIVGLPLGCL